MSNFYAKSNTSIKCKIAKLRVIRPKANASLNIINSRALYAKALKLNLQAFIYK
jgi:hypothetical protein